MFQFSKKFFKRQSILPLLFLLVVGLYFYINYKPQKAPSAIQKIIFKGKVFLNQCEWPNIIYRGFLTSSKKRWAIFSCKDKDFENTKIKNLIGKGKYQLIQFDQNKAILMSSYQKEVTKEMSYD